MTTLARPVALTMPGPRPTPVLGWKGNLIQFYRDTVGYMMALRRRYGDAVAFVEGGNPHILSANPGCPGTVFAFGADNNRHILSHVDLFHSNMLAAPDFGETKSSGFTALGQNLLGMNGELHRQQRRLMMPAFHRKRIDAYRDDMVALTQQALDGWTEGAPLDIAREMRTLTLRIASKTLFGLDVDAGAEAESIGGLIERWLGMVLSPAVVVFRLDAPGTPFRRFVQMGERVEREIRAMVEAKRARGRDDGDVLSMLIQSRAEDGSAMTEEQLIGQTNVLFIAGHETTANALTWTLFLLSQHPAVMADLYDELAGTLRGDAPSLAQVNELPLLERVIKESMRLLPPVPMSARVAVEDTELGPWPLPRWSEVIFSHYVTHHAPEIYSEPERFLPDRWLTYEPTAYEYLPFSAGARMCLGATFAMMEMKIVLPMLLQRYRLQLAPQARIDRAAAITLSPKQGMPMRPLAQDQRFHESQTAVQGNIREMVQLA